MNQTADKVKNKVLELLSCDKSGHGGDHVLRVYELALKFAETEKANTEIAGLAALLHDTDDYKLVGFDAAKELNNTKNILKSCSVPNEIQTAVIDIVRNMGYSKCLKGIRPKSLEGKIVSDADMCDAIGSSGIIRAIVYAVSDKGSGTIFDRNLFPNENISQEEYNSGGTTHKTDNAINHFFEKLLKLKDLMMTDSGKREAVKRQRIMVDFIRNFFEEENVPQKWFELLEKYEPRN